MVRSGCSRLAVTMRSSDPSLSAAEFTEHADFLRAIARGLVECEHAAEDLAQDAWLAALRRPPRGREQVRAWYVTVLRNLSVDRRRARARRTLHEEAAARVEELAPAAEVERRLEVLGRLGQLVQALEDPYRDAIYQRFYEGLPPRKIAAKLGVPVNTVKTRLGRGMDILRRRLDESDDGQRSSWCTALVPLIARPSLMERLGGLELGVAICGVSVVKLKLVLFGAILACVGTWMYFGSDSVEELSVPAMTAEPEVGDSQLAVASQDHPAEEGAATQESTRSALKEEPAPVAAAEPVVRGLRIFGRVTDGDGGPLAAATISAGLQFAGEPLAATADARGEYVIDLPLPDQYSPRAGCLLGVSATGPGHRSGFRSLPINLGDAEHEVDFELRSACVLRGTFLDTSGLPAAQQRAAAVRLDGSVLSWAWTDSAGTFELAFDEPRELYLAAGSGTHGYIDAGPFAVVEGEDTQVGALTLTALARLEGRISYPDGSPLRSGSFRFEAVELDDDAATAPDEFWLEGRPGARGPTQLDISGFGKGTARTDEDGGFELRALAPGSYMLQILSGAPRVGAPRAGPFRTGEFAEVMTDTHNLVVTVVDEDGFVVGEAFTSADSEDAACDESQGGTFGLKPWSVAVCPGVWQVSARRNGALPAMKEVVISPDAYHTEVELALDFSFEGSALKLVITDEANERIEACFLDILSSDGGTVIQNQISPGPGGVIPRVPVGEHRLRTTPGRDWYESWFDIEVPVTIQADQPTELELRARTGGWIEFDLVGSDDAVGTPVTITLLDIASEERTTVSKLMKVVDYPDWGRVGTAMSAAIGKRGRSALLAPGFYGISVEAEGRMARDYEVVVDAGQTTKVVVELEAVARQTHR